MSEGLPIPLAPGEESPPASLSKFEWARRELDSLLAGLDERCRFGCLFFNPRVSAFAEALRPARPAAREAARRFVQKVKTRRGTNIYAALEGSLPTTLPRRHFGWLRILDLGAKPVERRAPWIFGSRAIDRHLEED